MYNLKNKINLINIFGILTIVISYVAYFPFYPDIPHFFQIFAIKGDKWAINFILNCIDSLLLYLIGVGVIFRKKWALILLTFLVLQLLFGHYANLGGVLAYRIENKLSLRFSSLEYLAKIASTIFSIVMLKLFTSNKISQEFKINLEKNNALKYIFIMIVASIAIAKEILRINY